MSFGHRVRGLRRDLDLSQAELGSRAGCSVNTVRKLESDERKPSRELAARLAEVFELSPRERSDFFRLARGVQVGVRRLLPSPMTRLIGREADLASLRAQLLSPDTRLLSLVGPPGVGKTRLALQAATELQESFREGAAFVPLAAIHDPALVIDAVANALGVRPRAARSVTEVVVEQLSQQQLLLVLDNFEQVLAARDQLPPLLASAPRLRILVTSREPLGLYGEHLYPVLMLGLPGAGDRRRSASETLFLERARAVRPGFAMRAGDDALIADICVKLEGLPLAIELAASRARSMTPTAMRGELHQRLDVLSAGPIDFTPRQRSMRGALDWSYALLDPLERSLFGGLTVFVGGATLDAIAAVCASDVSVVHGLTDKSLLTLTEVAGQARFGMFEVVREYAIEKRSREVGDGTLESLRARHAAYFAGLAQSAPGGVRGRDHEAWLERLDAEHDNMRAALTWSLAHADADLAGRLGAGLWPYWRARGFYDEGRRWLDQILALLASAPGNVQADVSNGAGVLALLQTDYAVAQSHLEAARATFVAFGDRFGEAFATSNLGWLARNRGDIANAHTLFEASLRLRRDIGDRWGEAWTLNNLGVLALDQMDLAAGRELLTASVELFRIVGDRSGSQQALHNLGCALREDGDYPRARTLFTESLNLARSSNDARAVANSLGDLALLSLCTGDYALAAEQFEDSLVAYVSRGDRRNVAGCLEGLAGVAAVTHRPLEAARLFGLAAALRESLGAPLLATDRSPYDSTLAAARAQLDEDTWRRAWAEGQASTPEQLLPDLLA
jgi:predicted ATPase/DNA-binding XRE family transcriptional regulator